MQSKFRAFIIFGIILLLATFFVVKHRRERRLAGLDKESISLHGMERTYYVHVPSVSRSRQLPVVFAFHGRLGTGDGMSALSLLNNVSDRHGFLVVYPDGFHRSWADGRGKTEADVKGVDDIGFVNAMIEQLSKTYSIDRRRIYATGISNGGFFSERIGCELSDRFAAIGADAATLSQQLASTCKPARAIPMLMIMGRKDPLVPFNGGQMGGNNHPVILSARESLQTWAKWNGCEGAPEQQTISAGVHTEFYKSCRDHTEVGLYTIEGGGHTWPGGIQYLPEFVVGKTNRDIDAGEVFANFFERFSLPQQ